MARKRTFIPSRPDYKPYINPDAFVFNPEPPPSPAETNRRIVAMFSELNPEAPVIDPGSPGIGWRAVNQAWPEATVRVAPFVERLKILTARESRLYSLIRHRQRNPIRLAWQRRRWRREQVR